MKAQRVVWPSRAKVDIETFDVPPVGDDKEQHGTRISN